MWRIDTHCSIFVQTCTYQFLDHEKVLLVGSNSFVEETSFPWRPAVRACVGQTSGAQNQMEAAVRLAYPLIEHPHPLTQTHPHTKDREGANSQHTHVQTNNDAAVFS